jgi:glycosyltransferase involved in cell wall biosynthesis
MSGGLADSGDVVPKIAIILPAFNEELTIAETVEAFHRACPDARVVVVNNNSADNTSDIARETMNRLNVAGEVIDEFRQGKGNAIRRAFMECDADVYVMADADCTYPAGRLEDLVRPILERRADMVIGDRISGGHYRRENKRKFHDFGNDLVKRLVNRLFRAKLRDIMSGYRAFSRTFVKSYPILFEGYQLETDMTLHALDKRFRILEIPIEYSDRPSGSFSKLDTFGDGARVIFAITQILRFYRPLFFFGCISFAICMLGLVAALPVFSDWINYHYIYHVPLAVLAAALELVAVFSLGIGLVLDSITHQDKMKFERELLASSQDRPQK